MIATKRLNNTAMQRLILIPAVSLVLVMILSGTSQSRAFGVEGVSTQTSCVNDQPCQTLVCSEDQPCKVSETPNTDFDFEFDKDEGAGTGAVGLAPFSDPYNIYTEDQEKYLEDMQNMAEDAEYE